MQDRNVRARTGSLYTRDAGQGEAVVLLHEFPLNSRMWEPQVAALRDRCRLIAPDFAGFGLTPARNEDLSLAAHARDVLNTINVLQIERVTVVGLSLGSHIALHLAEELGAGLQGLLLSGASLAPDSPQVANWRHELAAEIELNGVEVAADEFLPKLLGTTTQQKNPALLDQLRLLVRENTPAGLAGMLRAFARRADPLPFLQRIRCPVLCIGGEEDLLTPLEAMHSVADQIPGALRKPIPEAGHLTNIEAPEQFNDAINQLLAESRPVSRPVQRL